MAIKPLDAYQVLSIAKLLGQTGELVRVTPSGNEVRRYEIPYNGETVSWKVLATPVQHQRGF